MITHYTDISFNSNSSVQVADAIFNAITPYDDRFSHITGTDIITIDNFTVQFTVPGSSCLMDGRVIFSTGNYNLTMTMMITDTIFYVLFKRQDSSSAIVSGFCWIKDDGVNYLGVGSGSANVAIEYMGFTNKNTGGRYYTVKRHAPFSFTAQELLFIPASIIADNAGNYQILSELRSCSNVAFNSMVSVNHINYYAIGTNTLLRDTGEQ